MRNEYFKRALKGYKAVKTVCKSANFGVGNGEVIIQAEDVEVSVRTDSTSTTPIMIDDTTLKLMEKVKNDDFAIYSNEIKAGTKTITYKCEEKQKPLIPTDDFKLIATIYQAELLDLIKGVKYSVATTEARPILTCIYWKDNEFVAIDGFRITIKNSSVSTSIPLLIVPKAYNLLEKLLDRKSDKPVDIYLDMDHTDTQHVIFDFDDIYITTLVGQGDYVDYKKVFDCKYPINFDINRKELLEKVEFMVQDKNPIVLDITKDKLYLTVQSVTNTLKDNVKIVNDSGEDLHIGFNPIYLIESLKNATGDIVNMQFINSVVSTLITHESGKDIVLPIKLK